MIIFVSDPAYSVPLPFSIWNSFLVTNLQFTLYQIERAGKVMTLLLSITVIIDSLTCLIYLLSRISMFIQMFLRLKGCDTLSPGVLNSIKCFYSNKTSIQWTPGSHIDRSNQNKTKYTMDPGIYFLMKTNK